MHMGSESIMLRLASYVTVAASFSGIFVVLLNASPTEARVVADAVIII